VTTVTGFVRRGPQRCAPREFSRAHLRWSWSSHEWKPVFPDPRLVAAIVDRVTFNAHILQTGTQSYRLRTTKTTSRSKKLS
jgi:hypothetical protein